MTLTKLTFTLENKEEVTLSFEDAKSLYSSLEDLFKKEIIYVPHYPCSYPTHSVITYSPYSIVSYTSTPIGKTLTSNTM